MLEDDQPCNLRHYNVECHNIRLGGAVTERCGGNRRISCSSVSRHRGSERAMGVEFNVDSQNRHTFNVSVGSEHVIESVTSYRTLGQARWAATRVLVELLDADLPNAQHLVAERHRRYSTFDRSPGIRANTPPRIG